MRSDTRVTIPRCSRLTQLSLFALRPQFGADRPVHTSNREGALRVEAVIAER